MLVQPNSIQRQVVRPKQPFPQLSIRRVLVAAFSAQILAVVSWVSWLSIHNGENATRVLLKQFSSQASDQIAHQVEKQLMVPQQLNQMNLEAMQLGLLNVQNHQQTERFFWKQMQVFGVGYLNYASQSGEFIGIERTDHHQLLINEVSHQFTHGKLHIYATNSRGDRTQRLAIKDYDPRVEAWYAEVVKTQKPLWSNIYQWEDKPEVLSISSSYPVYDRDRQMIGVMGVDLILTQLSDYLRQMTISPSSRAFIVERNGLLVANSSPNPPYQLVNGQAQRLKATESPDPLIRATATYLTQHVPQIKLDQKTQQSIQLLGAHQWVQVTPWKDEYGLDWLIVVVISESDFMAPVYDSTRLTILLSLAAVIIAIYLATLTAWWVSVPLWQLNRASQAIANGELERTIELVSIKMPYGLPRMVELDGLSQSFQHMAQQLQKAFETLAKSKEELEQRVEQRTIALKISEEKFSQVFWRSPIAMAISTPETGKIIEVNDVFLTYLGYQREEVIGQTSTALNLWISPDERICILYLLRQVGSVRNYECQIRGKSGQLIDVELSIEPIHINGQLRLLFAGTDIRDRKQAQAKIQASLQEKDILLKEIHHRVKNNLHVVANLLDLQSDYIQDARALELFSDSQSRIQSMALIHEQLYQSNHLGQINFGEYIHRLVDNLFLSCKETTGDIQSIIDAEPIFLNLETAVPCGLLINELITNAFKHAFVNRRLGQVYIRFHQDDQQTLKLTIQDDGIGIPDSIDWQDSPSFGLKLVRILSKQIRAQMQLDTNNGTTFHIAFEQLKYKPRV